MMRVLIADDDALVSDLLAHHCGKLDPNAVVELASDGQQALARLGKERFDLLVLDLQMPGLSGRELLPAIGVDLPVIIVTGDPDFALEAFQYNVVDYLIKPVGFDRFAQAWKKATMKAGITALPRDEARNVVFVREGSDIVRLDLRQVRYVKSDSNYVHFVTDNSATDQRRQVTSLMNMKDLEQKLPALFVRVHRSYIVNLAHVEKLDTMDIKIGPELIPVSETYRDEVLRRLDLL